MGFFQRVFDTITNPLPVYEDRSSLKVYVTIMQAGRPLTFRELLDRGNVSNGSLYPLIQRRVYADILIEGLHDGVTTYDLSPEAYWRVRPALVEAETDQALLEQCDQRFAPIAPSD